MQGKYEENPIHELYLILRDILHMKNKSDVMFNEIDDLFKLILLNNGCKIESNNTPHIYTTYIIKEEYNLCFITGMIGNDANEFYDFVIFNGMKILVIFLDYFNDISYGTYNSQDPMVDLKIAMGNSVYYDAIKKIVEVFYLTSEPIPGGLLTTAMVTTQRWNQAIIAIHILNEYKPVDENDVSDIPMEDIRKILAGNIALQLYGIRTM